MLPRLLALDLDGTLLPKARELPAAHIDTVKTFEERGCTVCIVTGRPLLTAQWPWRELGLDTPLVCFNGVWTGHPDHGVWDEAPLGEAEVCEILPYLRDRDGMTCCYPDPTSWVVDGFTARTVDWQDRYRVHIREDPGRFADWYGSSYKIMFVADPAVVRAVCAHLQRTLGDRFHVVISEPDRLEIHHKQTTKAWGLQRIAERLGIDAEDIWAAGDNDNDLEMITWAGTGFAMGGASPAIQAAADHWLPPASEHGLASLLSFI